MIHKNYSKETADPNFKLIAGTLYMNEGEKNNVNYKAVLF